MGKSTVGSKIDGRKKAKLIEKADGNGKNVNQVLEELIDKYLGDELKSEEESKSKKNLLNKRRVRNLQWMELEMRRLNVKLEKIYKCLRRL